MKLILLSRSEVAEVHNVLAVPTEECCRWMRATGLLHSGSRGGEGRRSRGRRRAVLRAGGEGAAERRDGDRNWVAAWCGCGQKFREMRLRPLKDSEEQDMPLVCACNVCVFWGREGLRALTHACAHAGSCPTCSHEENRALTFITNEQTSMSWGPSSPPSWGPSERSSVYVPVTLKSKKLQKPFSLNSRVCKIQLELSQGYLWSLFFPLTVNIHTFRCRNINVFAYRVLLRPHRCYYKRCGMRTESPF